METKPFVEELLAVLEQLERVAKQAKAEGHLQAAEMIEDAQHELAKKLLVQKEKK